MNTTIYDDVNDIKKYFVHGAVLEVIMAGIGVTYSAQATKRNIGIRSHGRNYILDSDGPILSAASGLAMIQGVVDAQGNNIGGYVVEYVDHYPENISNIKHYDVSYIEVNSNDKYGYTLNALGFIAFENANPAS